MAWRFRVTPLKMRLLRRRIDLARCGAWSVVTSGPPRGRGAVMATQITPQVIKLENLSVSTSARALQWSVMQAAEDIGAIPLRGGV